MSASKQRGPGGWQTVGEGGLVAAAAHVTGALTRKERIWAALERAPEQALPTSRLCAVWGETDPRRGYETLKYYRRVGLLDAVSPLGGAETLWKLALS